MQDKRALVREITEGLYNLSERVAAANIRASMQAGHMPHAVLYGFVMPVNNVRSYFSRLNGTLEDPTLSRTRGKYYVARLFGKSFSVNLPFNPFYLSHLRKESSGARRLLESMPQEELEEIYKRVADVSQQDLEGSVSHWVHAQEGGKAGQQMTEEDKVKMQPIIQAVAVVEAVNDLQQRYKLPL